MKLFKRNKHAYFVYAIITYERDGKQTQGTATTVVNTRRPMMSSGEIETVRTFITNQGILVDGKQITPDTVQVITISKLN